MRSERKYWRFEWKSNSVKIDVECGRAYIIGMDSWILGSVELVFETLDHELEITQHEYVIFPSYR